MNFFNAMVQKFMVEKSGVEKSFNVIARWNFNPKLFNQELLNPMDEKSGVEKFMVEKSGLKGPGLKLGVEKCEVEMSFNR